MIYTGKFVLHSSDAYLEFQGLISPPPPLLLLLFIIINITENKTEKIETLKKNVFNIVIYVLVMSSFFSFYN